MHGLFSIRFQFLIIGITMSLLSPAVCKLPPVKAGFLLEKSFVKSEMNEVAGDTPSYKLEL